MVLTIIHFSQNKQLLFHEFALYCQFLLHKSYIYMKNYKLY